MTKTRFAPSPTGYVHIGNVRTALFNALLAKHDKGIFLLRIEDTDQSRSEDEYTKQLEQDLLWLGLAWQEGPEVGGAYQPYFQSQRQAIYAKYYEQLEKAGRVYPCFCTDQELAIARKVQLSAGKPPRYQGTCRNLTTEQINEKIAQGLKPTLRFRVPDNQVIEFTDFVRGPQRFQSSEIGDFVIRRGDSSAAFFFCNAIDDAVMQVTHVLRGDDHLTNTPRQIMILQALGLAWPQYGHLALIVGPDGAPLSKRHGSRNIKELRQLGFLPQAIVNYLARVGHYYSDNSFMTFEQLAAGFVINNLGSAPAHYDQSQLLYWQKQAVQHMNEATLWQWMSDEVQQLISASNKDLFIQTVKGNITFPTDALHWAKIFFGDLHYTDEVKTILKQTDKKFFAEALSAIKQTGADFKALCNAISQNLNIKGKALFQPLRVALTGELHGPEMVHVVELLGQDKIAARLQAAANI